MVFQNDEGNKEYNFSLPNELNTNGITAFIRAKNEEDKIGLALGSIYEYFDQIIVIDNGSDDKTVEIVKAFKSEHDKTDKMLLLSYPFKLARNGPEHAATSKNSLHSIVYFSNYSMSFCKYKTICKWDADMILINNSESASFKNFLEKISKGTEYRWAVYGQTVYRALNGDYYSADDEQCRETRIFPFGYANRFEMHPSFEIMYSPLFRRIFDGLSFYELKFSDSDEFPHWSTNNFPTERKRREWEVLNTLKNNEALDNRYKKYTAEYINKNVTKKIH